MLTVNPPRPQLAILLDPEKKQTQPQIPSQGVDFFLIGGSGADGQKWGGFIEKLGAFKLPRILFPGNASQVHREADGILILNLLSGNNPQFLGEEQIRGASKIAEAQLECLPTAYLLIDGGNTSSVQRATKTSPLPNTLNPEFESCCLAAQQMGNKAIYLEAGSGAQNPVATELVTRVRTLCPDIHVFVGGGIKSPESALALWEAGAHTLVIGNGFEENPHILAGICQVKQRLSLL